MADKRKTTERRAARRRRLFNQQNGKCHYCRHPMTMRLGFMASCTIEHRIPQSLFSAGHPGQFAANLAASCWRCNNLKGQLTEDEFIKAVGPAQLAPPAGYHNKLDALRWGDPDCGKVRQSVRGVVEVKKRLKASLREQELAWNNLGKAGFNPREMGLEGAATAPLGESLTEEQWAKLKPKIAL